jgi:hypothetical protein
VRYILLSKNNNGKDIAAIGCFDDSNAIQDIPKLYIEINEKIPIDPTMDEYEKALEIGRFLRSSIVGGRGLGLSSEKCLKKMLAGEGGVCSDFSQIFNVFCFINGIKVKEWGCIDRFYKSQFGHSFNEFYSSRHKKWIAIDIQKSILFINPEDNIPFSVVELFTFLRNGNDLKFNFLSTYHPSDLERIYRVYSKKTIPFLICNYRTHANDYFLNTFQKVLPPFLINFIMIVFRKNHTFVFVLDNYKEKLLANAFKG